jgi:hypothetical protein
MLKINHVFEKIEKAKSGKEIRFQQDSASCHIAKQMIKFIEKETPLVE